MACQLRHLTNKRTKVPIRHVPGRRCVQLAGPGMRWVEARDPGAYCAGKPEPAHGSGMDKSGISHIARVLRGEGSSGQPSLARGFRLGAWRVRPDLCSLETDGRTVQLEPKTMGVLLCLAEHAPQVVTREQFIAEVWNGGARLETLRADC